VLTQAWRTATADSRSHRRVRRLVLSCFARSAPGRPKPIALTRAPGESIVRAVPVLALIADTNRLAKLSPE